MRSASFPPQQWSQHKAHCSFRASPYRVPFQIPQFCHQQVWRCQSTRSPQKAQNAIYLVRAHGVSRPMRCYCFKVRDQQKWKCQVDAGSSGAALFPLIPFTCRPRTYRERDTCAVSATSIAAAAASNSRNDDGATWESALIASLSVNQHMHSTPQRSTLVVYQAAFSAFSSTD